MKNTINILGTSLMVTAVSLISYYAFAHSSDGNSDHMQMENNHMMQGHGPVMGQGMMGQGMMGQGMMGQGMMGRGMMRRGIMGQGMMGQGMMHRGMMHRGMMETGAVVPADNSVTPEKVTLGKQLFFDPRLSKDGTVSCNSCHDLSLAGADSTPVSTGVGGAQGGRNSPTVWDAARHNAQFWDGRAQSLEEQAKGPLVNPVEMAMPDLDAVVKRVKSIQGYVTGFEDAFGKDSVNIDNIAKAIATYERTLISGNSKFDDFRFSGTATLSAEESQGFNTFMEVGCMQCHMGPDLAGPPPLARSAGFFQKFPQFTNNLHVAKYKLLEDNGRYDVTGNENDRHMYRVPSLRNVEKTAPYFHNGSVDALDEAVLVCGETTNERKLKDSEVKSIVAFLNTLNGEFPEQIPPVLPE